jgi:hypothetical protein
LVLLRAVMEAWAQERLPLVPETSLNGPASSPEPEVAAVPC